MLAEQACQEQDVDAVLGARAREDGFAKAQHGAAVGEDGTKGTSVILWGLCVELLEGAK